MKGVSLTVPENEVAAENQRRRMEEISTSPVGGVIEGATNLASPALVVGAAVIASGAPSATGMAIAGSVVAGFGIVDWFRKLGGAKVSENLESLGQATEYALERLENSLRGQGKSIDQLTARIESVEFKQGIASATLQALRTTQKNRLERMALILANGVKENDLRPESVDDMMRAAVELSGRDILELGEFVSRQSDILTESENSPMQWHDKVRGQWQTWVREDHNAYSWRRTLSYFELSGSRARIAAFGFIVAIRPNGTSNSPAEVPYALLPEGKKFFERIQEIATE